MTTITPNGAYNDYINQRISKYEIITENKTKITKPTTTLSHLSNLTALHIELAWFISDGQEPVKESIE